MVTASIGLNFGTHDATAAIVIDGAVVAAAEEERFTRVKQTKAFPLFAWYIFPSTTSGPG